MLIFDDELKPLLLENKDDPIPSALFWVLDMDVDGNDEQDAYIDFMFKPIGFIEEYHSKCITFDVGGQRITLPSHWNILLADEETSAVDLVSISDIKGRELDVYVFSFNQLTPKIKTLKTINAHNYEKFCHPIIPKNSLLVHPIYKDEGVIITPKHLHKRFNNKYIFDIFR